MTTTWHRAALVTSTRGFAPHSGNQRSSTLICYLFENYCNLILQFAFGNEINLSPLFGASFISFYPRQDELGEIMEYTAKAETGYGNLDPNVSGLYIALVLNRLLRIAEDGRSESFSENISYIQEALMIISSDLSVQLTANRVAEMMNVSTAKFRADFKRHTGTTFKKFLTDLRMTRAYELLQSGSSIINASLETGYSSEAHFIAAFRRYWGRTPGSFAPVKK